MSEEKHRRRLFALALKLAGYNDADIDVWTEVLRLRAELEVYKAVYLYNDADIDVLNDRNDAEIARLNELLRGVGANRYWEGRWRDADAKIARLCAEKAKLVEALRRCLHYYLATEYYEPKIVEEVRDTLASVTEPKGEP
jgi:hypothetical protein